MTQPRNKALSVDESPSNTTKKLMKELFSKESLQKEQSIIKNNSPELWGDVPASYHDLEHKINLAKNMLANINISKSQFKQFLLSKGADEYLVALAEVLSEDAESTNKNSI